MFPYPNGTCFRFQSFSGAYFIERNVDSSKSLGILAHRTWEWWLMEPKYLAFRFGDWIHPNHHHLTWHGETFGSLGNPGWHQITPLHHTFASSKINPLPTQTTSALQQSPKNNTNMAQKETLSYCYLLSKLFCFFFKKSSWPSPIFVEKHVFGTLFFF